MWIFTSAQVTCIDSLTRIAADELLRAELRELRLVVSVLAQVARSVVRYSDSTYTSEDDSDSCDGA